ncbi:MAG TPA: molecular chaperone DnaK [Kofleriaceae bacterium]|nr:molecular chaperone DnaK [Kofleriaceae bacterium]
MAPVIGIDLGTTNSCVAVMDGNQTVVIANSEGSRTTPSVVGFAEGGERLIGQIAKRQAMTNPDNTIYAVKRLMGRKLEDPDVQRLARTSPYEIVASDNGDAHVRARGKVYSPPEISAMVLTKMRQTAEDYLGTPVSEAVITVPAYFDDAQRQATKDAGRIAGLDVLRIINEPTAAALAYGHETEAAERVVVYDLGGGTFDVSILELQGGIFRVRATSGDTFLGGEDFDNAIVQHLLEGFSGQHGGLDLRGDKMALQRLKEAAEKAKHELSSSHETEINLPFIAADDGGPKHLQARFGRRDLEELVEPFVQRTLDPCRQALADAGLTAGDIDVVVLVGGQTRMPRIQSLVAEFFQTEPHRGVNPDEVVAIGAAIQGGVLTGEVQEVLLLDVTPLSLGVETAGGVMTKLIERNSTIPTRATEIFSTAVDNQDFVNVHVLQGEREMADACKSLAYFQLLGIPPAPRGVPRIEVAFDLDANGILMVAAKDLGTGRKQSVNVVPTSGLNESEIDRIIREADESADADRDRAALIAARNKAESLLYTSERALVEFGEVLGVAERANLEQDLSECRRVVEAGTLEQVNEALERLELSAQRIGEIIYERADDADGAGEG